MILANGGIPDVRKEGKGNEARFWITPSDGDPEGSGVSQHGAAGSGSRR
jgi:hypothetical protein